MNPAVGGNMTVDDLDRFMQQMTPANIVGKAKTAVGKGHTDKQQDVKKNE